MGGGGWLGSQYWFLSPWNKKTGTYQEKQRRETQTLKTLKSHRNPENIDPENQGKPKENQGERIKA